MLAGSAELDMRGRCSAGQKARAHFVLCMTHMLVCSKQHAETVAALCLHCASLSMVTCVGALLNIRALALQDLPDMLPCHTVAVD